MLLCASAFHLLFEDLHPFCDGNGRLGRVLVKLLLDMYFAVPCSLLFRSRNDYLAVLRLSRDPGQFFTAVHRLAGLFVFGTAEVAARARQCIITQDRALKTILAGSAAEAEELALLSGAPPEIARRIRESFRRNSTAHIEGWCAVGRPSEIDIDEI